MATSFMSNWTPLWRMSAKEAVPYGVKSIQNLLGANKLQAPANVLSWIGQRTMASPGFTGQFLRLAGFSFLFQTLFGFLPHLLFGKEKQYFSMGTFIFSHALSVCIAADFFWFPQVKDHVSTLFHCFRINSQVH